MCTKNKYFKSWLLQSRSFPTERKAEKLTNRHLSDVFTRSSTCGMNRDSEWHLMVHSRMDESVGIWSFFYSNIWNAFLFPLVRALEMVYPMVPLPPKLTISHFQHHNTYSGGGESASTLGRFAYSSGTLKKFFWKRKGNMWWVIELRFLSNTLESYYRGSTKLKTWS